MNSKSAVRREYLLRRRTIHADRRHAWDTRIRKRVLALPEVANAGEVLAHIGVAPEVDTREIVSELIQRGTRVIAPVMDENDDVMRWGVVDSVDTLVHGPYGILQPPDETLVPAPASAPIIVPCVAFTERCERLGRGGGHYDRFLASHAGPKIAVAYECQRADAFPVEPHDISVDAVVTEGKVYRT
jgi:5-formyltetrahydrofolate cyclo-ligase